MTKLITFIKDIFQDTMNSLQQILLALVSGYVLAEMFKLPYSECIYVACMSAIPPLLIFFTDVFIPKLRVFFDKELH